MSGKLPLQLQFMDGGSLTVQVDGLSTPCRELQNEVKNQLKSKYFKLYYVISKKHKQIVDFDKPINSYFDPKETLCFFIKKQIHVMVNLNGEMAYENGFDQESTVEDVLKMLKIEGYNLIEFDLTLCDNLAKIQYQGIQNQGGYQVPFGKLPNLIQPLHIYIKCKNVQKENQKNQNQYLNSKEENTKLEESRELLQQWFAQLNQLQSTTQKILQSSLFDSLTPSAKQSLNKQFNGVNEFLNSQTQQPVTNFTQIQQNFQNQNQFSQQQQVIQQIPNNFQNGFYIKNEQTTEFGFKKQNQQQKQNENQNQPQQQQQVNNRAQFSSSLIPQFSNGNNGQQNNFSGGGQFNPQQQKRF